MQDKEAAFNKIATLVERFREQLPSYKRVEYNETLTRRDFIDPFFKALGWDIDNEQGYAEAYREVIHEDKVRIGSSTKAPDYSFRLPGGKRLFFVEAKKPSVLLKDEMVPAYQVRRYGWSAKLPISIITDFEEFAVYDCTIKPFPNDKASVSRVKYLTFNEYLKEFDFIWDTFSKEKVLRGSFDKFVAGTANKKGTAAVDDDFLQSLDKWRNLLATAISKQNKEIDEDELNYAVQATIDRLIFLRIAEDRSIEPYGNLAFAVRQGDYFRNLYSIFKDADDKYNSGLFDLKKDNISANLVIDNKTVKTIVDQLYYPECPYEFSVLSVEILGSAYEQFLGKQIRINKSHKAVIEEKPEVRKAGGVYYTPQYIVEYIVKNTVGKLVEGKTPEEVSALKILDPACGSGSFLIGAYQYLLDWHKSYYQAKSITSKGGKQSPVTPDGNLTTAEKKRILLNNIFGVDLDVNAVEVTKLSLLLKCLEGETEASIKNQLSLFNERVLPTLDENIKSGNSLIDLDFYDAQIEFEQERKVKPFSWQKAFPKVFNSGNPGFDAVIGNPPWVDIKGQAPELVKYYFNKYETCSNRINLYAVFIERALKLLNHNPLFGFIIPNSLLYQSSYQELRKYILKSYHIEKIIRLPDNTFHKVKAETIIITLGKTECESQIMIYDRDAKITSIAEIGLSNSYTINQSVWASQDSLTFDIFNDDSKRNLLSGIESCGKPLEFFCDFTLGLTPYDKYKGHTEKQIKQRVFHSTEKKTDTFKPLLSGGDVKRFSVVWNQEEYINYGKWLAAPREQRFFIEPRILVRQIISGVPPRIYAGYTEDEFYNTQSIFNLVLKPGTGVELKYILGILNSRLMNFFHKYKYLDVSKRLFQKILIQNCKQFPIVLDKNNPQIREQIIQYVDELILLNQNLLKANLPTKVEQMTNKISYFEDKLNNVIYELYNISQKDREIIDND